MYNVSLCIIVHYILYIEYFRMHSVCFVHNCHGISCLVASAKMCQGCIVGPDLAVMSLVLVKKGAEEIPGFGALGGTSWKS